MQGQGQPMGTHVRTQHLLRKLPGSSHGQNAVDVHVMILHDTTTCVHASDRDKG